jgi:hypothetical protein
MKYFNLTSNYAGQPVEESKTLFNTIANQYTVNRDSYNSMMLALSQTDAVSDSEKDYLKTVKTNLTDSIAQVAKDVQGGTRWETASKAVNNLALKFATDENIKHIKDNFKLYSEQEKVKNALRTEGKSPIGFETDLSKFQGLTTVDGEISRNKYKGWYEPKGANLEGYNQIAQNIGYKGDLATSEEKAKLKSAYDNFATQADSLAETNQDIRALTEKLGSKEKAMEFIYQNRLPQAVLNKSAQENQLDIYYDKEDVRQENALKRQEALYEEKAKLEEVKTDGKKDVITHKQMIAQGALDENGNRLFELADSTDDLKNNPYKQSFEIDDSQFDTNGKFVNTDYDSMRKGVNSDGSRMFTDTQIKNKQTKANNNFAKIKEFKDANPEFAKYSDKTVANIYNKAIAKEDAVVGQIHQIVVPEAQKQALESKFRTDAFTSRNVTIVGQDANDKSTFAKKLEKQAPGFDLNKPYTIDFKGVKTITSDVKNEQLGGAYVYSIGQGENHVSVIVPSPLKDYTQVLNLAHKQGLATPLGKTTKPFSAANLLGQGIFLETHKDYDVKTGNINTRYKVVFEKTDKTDYEKQHNTGYIVDDNALKEYSTLKKIELNKDYTLSELQELSLFDIAKSPQIKNILTTNANINNAFGIK